MAMTRSQKLSQRLLIIKVLECFCSVCFSKKGKRKVQGVPQSQTAALTRHQEDEENDNTKRAQIEQKYEKH